LRAETKERLETAAAKAGRSLSEEIERRLEASFEREDCYGGPDTDALLHQFAGAIGFVQQRTGRRWSQDYETYLAVIEALEGILKWVRRTMQPKPSPKSVAIVQEMIEAEPTWPKVPRPTELELSEEPQSLSVAPGEGLLGGYLAQLISPPPRFPSVQDAKLAAEAYAQFDREYEQYKLKMGRAQDYFAHVKVVGEEAAASVIPDAGPSKV
jgi:hypothetical protein